MDRVLGWFLISCAFAAMSAALTIVWWHARERAVRAERLVDRLLTERTTLAPQRQAPASDMMEIIATEVERIGEGQRFLTNSLLDKGRVHEPEPHNP